MAGRSVAALKFVGCVSLGLLTGVSYTLTTIAIPTLLAFPSASSAGAALTHLKTRTITDLNIYTCISATSLFAAYIFSPRAFAHPYLLMSTALVVSSALTDVVLPSLQKKTASRPGVKENPIRKMRGLESSYEVLGDSSEGEGELTPSESDDEINGEEVRKNMENFRTAQALRTGLAGISFAISVVGIWGDGF